MLGELVAKFWNAAGGFWDSLDDQQRVVLGYLAIVAATSLLSMLRQRSQQRLKNELLEELRASRP